MQTTTSTPARSGIQLNQQLFRKAIEKALAVQPRVLHVGAHYGVMQSDQKSWAHVIFRVLDNRLFASCTCFAHTRGNAGCPIPCYHIAAAALSNGATALIAAQAPAPRWSCRALIRATITPARPAAIYTPVGVRTAKPTI